MDLDASSLFDATFAGVTTANAIGALFAYGAFFYTWHELKGTEETPKAQKYFLAFLVPVLINAALGLIVLKNIGPDYLRTPFTVALSASLIAHMFCLMFGYGIYAIIRRRRVGPLPDDQPVYNWMMVVVPIAVIGLNALALF